MIPASRSKRSGAYRDLMRNYIDGEEDIEHRILGRKNVLTSTLTTFDSLNLGFFNSLQLRKRLIAIEHELFKINSTVSLGNFNDIYIKYWSDKEEDYSVSVVAVDNNNVDVFMPEQDNLDIGSGNHIRGVLNISNSGTTIGDNNILIDFTPELTTGSVVSGLPELSELMVKTEIASVSGLGETAIEVEDPSKIMLGGKIFFGTVGAAYADRIVTSVDGNFVGFGDPLLSKETTVMGSIVFNHYPETVSTFNSSLSEDVAKGSKRIILSDLGSLHLRDIVIGGSFTTKSFFQRTSDNMVIIRDSTDAEYLAGTTVISDGFFPYSSWVTSAILSSGSTYMVSDPRDNAYIGRLTTIDTVDYYITGFTSSTITFNAPLPMDSYPSLTFSEVDDALGGGPSTTVMASNTAGNSNIIEVEDASTFFVGQVLRIEVIVKLFIVNSISGNLMTLDEQIFGDSISNSFYIGRIELPIDIVATKIDIEAGALDLNAYVFGG